MTNNAILLFRIVRPLVKKKLQMNELVLKIILTSRNENMHQAQ